MDHTAYLNFFLQVLNIILRVQLLLIKPLDLLVEGHGPLI